MARRFYNRIRTGVAGWSYDDWAGVAYPDPEPRGFDPLGYLSGFLDLIEVNSTFYGPPEPEHATRWAEVVADRPRFRFTAKLWCRFTHDREQAWSRSDVRKVSVGIAPLLREDRLDALLAQFPWSFRNDETNREWLEDLTGAFAEFPLVVEVRHASWNDPDFDEWLAERGVGFVNIDQPLFSPSIAPSARVEAPPPLMASYRHRLRALEIPTPRAA